MSAASPIWLPPPTDGELESAATALVASWAEEWFGSRDGLAVRRDPEADERCEWLQCGGSALGILPAGLAKLGMVLAGNQADLSHPGDEAVLKHLAQEAVAELATRLSQVSLATPGGPFRPAGDGCQVFRLSRAEEGWFLLLSVDRNAQAAARKSAAGKNRHPVLAPLSEALAPEPVKIGCHIGTAVISTKDLAGLAEGDLVTFDRRVIDDLPVTVAAVVVPSSQARIVHEGASVVVRLARGIDIKQPQ